MPTRSGILSGIFALAFCLLCLPWASNAQSKPQRHVVAPPSRLDVFAGFSYLHPYSGGIAGNAYQPITSGAATSVTGYFGRYFGLQAEGGFHPDGPNDCIYTAQGGPVFRLAKGRWVPFVHVLGGGAKIGGPVFQPCSWGWGITSGAGLDYVLPQFHNHLALRAFQADWQHAHVGYGPLIADGAAGGEANVNDYRLSAGMVLRLGEIEKILPLQITCSLHPEMVFVGDPVMVSLQTANVNPKLTAVYSWSSTGGRIDGSGDAVTVDTKGLAAGSYTVTATVVEGKRSRQRASCHSTFKVGAYDPPTVTCVANPSRVKPGESSSITSNGISPQNRVLTYSFATDAGQLGAVVGNTSTLGTVGVPVGTVTVTCHVIDDLDQPAQATTMLTIVPPPPPPPPPTRQLCSISFARDRKRPVRVDNEAKGCLDDIALALTREPDARLEIVGHADAGEEPQAAEQRAINTKQYLTGEKGIDPTRIDLRTGLATGRQVDSILVPPGAIFSGEDSAFFDERTVKPQAPLKAH